MSRASTVTVGIIHPGEWRQIFGHCLGDLYVHDITTHNRIRSHECPTIEQLCADVVVGRNQVAEAFLRDSQAEWLWFVDTDMGFAPDTVDRLIDSAHRHKAPILGALCFAGVIATDASFGGRRSVPVPTIYDAVETPDTVVFRPRLDYDRDALVECDATGAACLLIHRRVLETVAGRAFDKVAHPKAATPFGEDFSFCIRARQHGFPVHVDTAIKTTHDKGWFGCLDEEFFDVLRGGVS